MRAKNVAFDFFFISYLFTSILKYSTRQLKYFSINITVGYLKQNTIFPSKTIKKLRKKTLCRYLLNYNCNFNCRILTNIRVTKSPKHRPVGLRRPAAVLLVASATSVETSPSPSTSQRVVILTALAETVVLTRR